MQKVQKTYTPEFKQEAVRLAQTSGKPIAQVARELGISDTSIHQWRKELSEHGGFRISRQWTSNRAGRGAAPTQTRAGKSAAGA
jgi:transposase-like protein